MVPAPSPSRINFAIVEQGIFLIIVHPETVAGKPVGAKHWSACRPERHVSDGLRFIHGILM